MRQQKVAKQGKRRADLLRYCCIVSDKSIDQRSEEKQSIWNKETKYCQTENSQEKKITLVTFHIHYSCCMLRYVHQLVTNFACLLCGAGQVIELILKQLLKAMIMGGTCKWTITVS